MEFPIYMYCIGVRRRSVHPKRHGGAAAGRLCPPAAPADGPPRVLRCGAVAAALYLKLGLSFKVLREAKVLECYNKGLTSNDPGLFEVIPQSWGG